MDSGSFDKYEEKLQEKFRNVKIPFKPCVVVTIKLLRFRGISVGYSDVVDTPDPQFQVICEKLQSAHVQKFKTRSIPDNVTEGDVDEEFSFVVPEYIEKTGEAFPITIRLVDRDVFIDDEIGDRVIDVSKLPVGGKPLHKTLHFGKNNGEVDIIIQKILRKSPEFRSSLELCPEEIAFRKKRIPLAREAMCKILNKKQAPKDAFETPVVSIVGSGGGYRAVIGMSGAMEALSDAGVLDTATYSCGLSGSGWYLSAAYGTKGAEASTMKTLHKHLREQFNHNALLDMVNPLTVVSYMKYAKASLEKFKQPQTFVNYFPGYLVGKRILGEKNHSVTLSDIAPYVKDAKVPYPVIVTLHVRNRVAAYKFHAYMERSPYEIYLPSCGIGINPKNEGSFWSHGFVVRKCPEYPLHFTIGMTGCAFAILLNQFFKYGDEAGYDLFERLDQIRLEDKSKANKDLDLTERVAEIESDEDSDDDLDDVETPRPVFERNHSASLLREKFSRVDSALGAAAMGAFTTVATPTSTKLGEDMPYIIKKIKNNSFFTSRNAIVGRTAKLQNFAYDVGSLEKFNLNPFKTRSRMDSVKEEVIEAVGHSTEGLLSNQTNTLSFVDAGILKNVPTDAMLRPQRGTDLMIVMDFSSYKSDEEFSYKALITAAAHSWQSGLKFPEINIKELLSQPPKEFLAFPSDSDDCPTVLWFTLSNKKFKELKNYKPKTTEATTSDDKKAFNDFPVFGNGSFASTFKFHYTNHNFDQIKELMYYNVTSHIQEIKEALAEAVARKRRRLNRT